MGNNPIRSPRRGWTAHEIEERQLETLRERYADGHISFEQHARYVEAVLRGEQPEEDGLPVLPDPELEHWVL